ncbi:MAG: serine/threonine protein kinase [Deltaproteobacteria bacterium]|nr:serine/threonine protein kinase [Deltaproteobacteria bacterium]
MSGVDSKQGETQRPTRAGYPAARVAEVDASSTDQGLDDTLVAESSEGRPPNDTDRWLGQTLAGRYTLLRPLGRGGMATVYLARHELLKKHVAVKLLRDDIAVSEASFSRFRREAMAAASIGDPHIVDITDCDFTEDGRVFIVMEWLQGADLRVTLRASGPMPPGRAVAIARQVLRGLIAAHAQGIIHRDLKAENVFLSQRDGGDFVKLLDFGISKMTHPPDGESGSDDEPPLYTSTGVVIGTPQYIAPEQAHGDRDVDERADIYALGVMLYEMLTGELPFTGKSALDVVMKHVQEQPVPPRRRKPELGIPVQLERIVLRAMQKERADRYPSAAEMLRALPASDALSGGYASTRLDAAPRARRLWHYGALLVGLLLGSAALVWVAVPTGSTPSIESSAVADAGSLEPAAIVTLDVVVKPTGASIYLDGRAVAVGRLVRKVKRGSAPLKLTFRAEGFEARDLVIPTEVDRRVEVELEPVAPVTNLPRVGHKRLRGKRMVPSKVDNGAGDLRGNPYLPTKRSDLR